MCLLESKAGVVTNKNFWSVIKTFPTNKDHINGEGTMLKCDNETISDSSVLAEMLNSHYINIFEKTSGKNTSHFNRDNNASDTRQARDLIVQSYLDHSSINRTRLLVKIKSPQLHLLAMLVEQIQKKYLNF